MTTIAIALSLMLAATGAAQLPAPTEKGYVYWEYSTEELDAGQVTLFSVCLDAQPCAHVPIADARAAVAGWWRWKLPPLTVGDHTVKVQACNPITCGAAESVTFRLVVAPAKVRNLHAAAGGATP